jgi:hypothetical protein
VDDPTYTRLLPTTEEWRGQASFPGDDDQGAVVDGGADRLADPGSACAVMTVGEPESFTENVWLGGVDINTGEMFSSRHKYAGESRERRGLPRVTEEEEALEPPTIDPVSKGSTLVMGGGPVGVAVKTLAEVFFKALVDSPPHVNSMAAADFSSNSANWTFSSASARSSSYECTGNSIRCSGTGPSAYTMTHSTLGRPMSSSSATRSS